MAKIPSRVLIIEEVNGGFLLTAADGEHGSVTTRTVASSLEEVVQSVRATFASGPNPPCLNPPGLPVYREDGEDARLRGHYVDRGDGRERSR